MQNNTLNNITDELENVVVILTGLSSILNLLGFIEYRDNTITDTFLFFEHFIKQTSDQLDEITKELLRLKNRI